MLCPICRETELAIDEPFCANCRETARRVVEDLRPNRENDVVAWLASHEILSACELRELANVLTTQADALDGHVNTNPFRASSKEHNAVLRTALRVAGVTTAELMAIRIATKTLQRIAKATGGHNCFASIEVSGTGASFLEIARPDGRSYMVAYGDESTEENKG